jgi:hypothetical protein
MLRRLFSCDRIARLRFHKAKHSSAPSSLTRRNTQSPPFAPVVKLCHELPPTRVDHRPNDQTRSTSILLLLACKFLTASGGSISAETAGGDRLRGPYTCHARLDGMGGTTVSADHPLDIPDRRLSAKDGKHQRGRFPISPRRKRFFCNNLNDICGVVAFALPVSRLLVRVSSKPAVLRPPSPQLSAQ